jgi:hypothetical protein
MQLCLRIYNYMFSTQPHFIQSITYVQGDSWVTGIAVIIELRVSMCKILKGHGIITIVWNLEYEVRITEIIWNKIIFTFSD